MVRGAPQKPELDNLRKLRSINFTDPEGGESTLTIKNARNKLDNSFASGHALQDGDKTAF